MKEMFLIWNENGMVVKILIMTSVYMTAVIFEKVYVFIKFYLDLRGTMKMVNFHETETLKTGSLTKKIFNQIKHSLSATTDIRDNLISINLDMLNKQLMQFVPSLGLIAALAPMLGLIGTFVGVMKVFEGVSATGLSDPTIVAVGIKEALVTTIAGLSLAIPAMIAYKTFENTTVKFLITLEEKIFLFLKKEEEK